MKSNPLLLAITFLLGCLVAMVAFDNFRQPVYADAQGGSPASVENLTIATMTIDSEREALFVFKRIPNPMAAKAKDQSGRKKVEVPEGDQKFVTSLAVYEYQTSGIGRGELILTATRFIDYDMYSPEYANKNGKPVAIKDTREAFLDTWDEKLKPADE